MTTLLAIAIFVILALTAALHVYWAAGGLWPGKDGASLARTVIGANGIDRMPPAWLTGLIAIGIAAAALWPMLWLGWIAAPLPGWLVTTGMIVLTLVFLGRGAVGFVPAVQAANSEQPFATLNARYFSPLIVVIGLALLWLLVANWSATR